MKVKLSIIYLISTLTLMHSNIQGCYVGGLPCATHTQECSEESCETSIEHDDTYIQSDDE